MASPQIASRSAALVSLSDMKTWQFRSRQNGGAVPPASATTTGAPLVASRVGDIPDIVTHGETGLLADPTPEALAGAVIAALDAPEQTAARAEAARVFAREACGWDVVGAQMLEMYRGMVGT